MITSKKNLSKIFQLKIVVYEKRTHKHIIDNILITALFVIFALRDIKPDKTLFNLLCTSYFLYVLSGFLVIARINWLRRNLTTNQILSTAILYSIVDKMQLVILFMCFWMAGVRAFRGSVNILDTTRSLSILMMIAWIFLILIFPKIIKTKLYQSQSSKQQIFAKSVPIFFSVLGLVAYMYFLIISNIQFKLLDFVISTLGVFLSWLLIPNLLWDICESILFLFIKWPKDRDVNENL